jgi:hypothetical protein
MLYYFVVRHDLCLKQAKKRRVTMLIYRNTIICILLLFLGCKSQPANPTTEDHTGLLKGTEKIINPCGFLNVATRQYLDQGGDLNTILDNPAWLAYANKGRKYVARVKAGYIPPPQGHKDYCGGGDGPPLPPGFSEPTSGVEVEITCLGDECNKKDTKK